MKKLAWDLIPIIIAALLSLLIFTLSSLLIAALLNDLENLIVQNLMLVLFCTGAFVFSLIYVKKVRNGDGNDEVFADYKNAPYVSPKEDLRFVLAREKWTLVFMFLISIVCCVIDIVWIVGKGNTIANPISFSMIAMLSLKIFFPIETVGVVPYVLGCILSPVFSASAYIGAMLLYRKNEYEKHA